MLEKLVYSSSLAKYLEAYPRYRGFGLWLLSILACVMFLMSIFPAVAINDELNEKGGAKHVYDVFSKMLWGQYSDKVSISGGAMTVNAEIILTMVGFAMYTKYDSAHYNSETYEYATWEDCKPSDNTQVITPEAMGFSAIASHRHLTEKSTAEYICDAKDDCQVALQNAEGLIGFTLFLLVAGTGCAAYRLHQQPSRMAHQLNSKIFFLVMLMSIIIVTTYNNDCVAKIESILEDRRNAIAGATNDTSHKLGNLYNIFVAISVLSAFVFVVNFLVFPAPEPGRAKESGAAGASAPAPARKTTNPIAEPDAHSEL